MAKVISSADRIIPNATFAPRTSLNGVINAVPHGTYGARRNTLYFVDTGSNFNGTLTDPVVATPAANTGTPISPLPYDPSKRIWRSTCATTDRTHKSL